MKKRLLSIVLLLCLCISSQSVAYAAQNVPSQPGQTRAGSETEDTDSGSEPEETAEKTKAETDSDADTDPSETPTQPEETEIESEMESESETKRSVEKPDIPDIDSATLTPEKVYDAMIALQGKTGYTEGSEWTDYVPYSGKGEDVYRWNGGALGGSNIVAVGCVAFAFTLSDAAFGRLPARMYANGAFKFEDIKVGDILRMNTDTHTVIVLRVSDTGVVVAEGNNSGKVHWGRAIDKDTVMNNTSHYITRYPENYTPPTDPGVNDIVDQGTLDGGLTWKLIKAGTLTISGNGAMPDFASNAEQPWIKNSGSIYKVVIENGVTSIGACAFWKCGVLSAEISSSVQSIGNSALRETDIMSVKIPSSVKTIGDSAFRECQGLGSVTISNGVETISQNAFRACGNLTSISLPASIGEVGAAAFFECDKLTTATFAPGSKKVHMGDNVFARCYSLMSIKLPQSIDCIGAGMFQNCGMLTGVQIPEGAERIGEFAFASCSGMSVVVIPSSVMTIESSVFSACPLKDIYFTGDEAQWRRIDKLGDTPSAVSKATIHYNYDPSTDPDPGEGDDNTGDDSGNNNGGQNPGDSGNNNGGQNPGNSSNGNKPDQKSPSKNSADKDDSAERESDVKAAVETWKPTTPDEVRRYACVGRETIRCSLPKENAYKIDIENAMQGPMCFKSFEAVLGEYTIGRTYNIYADSKTTYSTAEEVQLTIEIPSAIYRKDREYKMICVTKGGLPVVYEDQDRDPKTITIETDKFHAYALVYK
ncbi:MAG: leucine-rich repeat domain-containing protein [Lachnospiraceae bacterium]|nr:leucine-rich repeat domain-containing protein [Lachnospiraceae bacterium]